MDESVSIGFRTDAKTAQTLDELAERMCRTRNSLLNVIVKNALAGIAGDRKEDGYDDKR